MDTDKLLLIACLPLACWRLSSMLTSEAGPFEVFEWVRHKTQGQMLGDLLACVWCTSVWVSAGLLAAATFVAGRYVVYWLALSALAILVDVTVERIKR